MRASVAFAALAALLVSAPASANFWDGPGGNMPRARDHAPVTFHSVPSETARNLDRALDAAEARRDSGELSRREYRQLKREARLIARMEQRYAFDGLSQGEQSELDVRSRHLIDVAASRTVRR